MGPMRAWKNNRGLTLIEVMISLVIVFIVFIGLSSSGLLVLEENIKNSLRDEAVSVTVALAQAPAAVPTLIPPTTTRPISGHDCTSTR
mgnify:CR=1 FL=1